jgi:O-antigen ligase
MRAITNNKKIPFYLALLSAFTISLKLSFCLAFLIPLVLLWICKNIFQFRAVTLEKKEFKHLTPLFILIIVAFYCAPFGIDPLRSLMNFPSFIFFSIIPFAICDAFYNKKDYLKLAGSLLAGQALAGIYSVIEVFIPGSRQVFLGAVTQSGQIAITFLLATGMLFYFHRSRDYPPGKKYSILICLTILGLTLLVNLKRGPWMGVIAGSAVFLYIFSKRVLVTFIAVVALIFLTVSPVRDRVMASYEHFSIIGGREAIWDIGSELALRYPLGIGYHNSYVLTKFSTEIPETLKHFHNNFLNILVETGWLGLFLYIWWIWTLLRYCWGDFDDRYKLLIGRAIGCAIISWQTAGMVEYNFGDSEIFILVMIVLGLSALLKRNATLS